MSVALKPLAPDAQPLFNTTRPKGVSISPTTAQGGKRRVLVSCGEQRRQGGFSLLEVAVCIVILLVLIMIVQPTAMALRKRGRAVKCIQNLRQLWHGGITFAQEHNGYFSSVNIDNHSTNRAAPGFRDYVGYKETAKLYRDTVYSCPQVQAGEMRSRSNMNRSYSVARLLTRYWDENNAATKINGALERINRVEYPSRALYIVDGVPLSAGTRTSEGMLYATNINSANSESAGYVHNGHSNAVFLDGHVSALKPDDLKKPKVHVLWGGTELD